MYKGTSDLSKTSAGDSTHFIRPRYNSTVVFHRLPSHYLVFSALLASVGVSGIVFEFLG